MSMIFDEMQKSDRHITKTEARHAERRKQKRTGVRLAARLRPADSSSCNFDEVLFTTNASRGSLYFITTSGYYRQGMRLRVIFPYNSAHDSVGGIQEDGVVHRTEPLENNRVGVAVQLRCPASTVCPSPSSKPVRERRASPRHSFSATVFVTDSRDGMRLQGRCSDLSLGGCYVDTLNPFSPETIVQVEFRRGDELFESAACVNSSHPGMGMGLCFQGLTPDQIKVLLHWLNDLKDECSSTPAPPETPKRAESAGRTKAINLIQQMISQCVITKADVLALFSDPII